MKVCECVRNEGIFESGRYLSEKDCVGRCECFGGRKEIGLKQIKNRSGTIKGMKGYLKTKIEIGSAV